MSSALLVISFPVPETYRSTSLSGIFSGFSAARLRSTRRRSNIESPSCKCHVADAASATSAAYGALLLGGGLFACIAFIFFLFFSPLSYNPHHHPPGSR
uniref:Uncharacterized protein n=1 Tax=Rhizophora mucronata TaxID=61149 RepID=A0A2P2K1D0_RHIMU